MNRVDNNNINKQRRMRESEEYKVEYTVMISGCVRFYATVKRYK